MIGGTLGWAVLGTSNTTGTAGQVLGIGSSGSPGFINGTSAATPIAAGTVVGYTQNSCCNTALGCSAYNISSTGSGNIAIGSQALNAATSGCSNLAIGFQALTLSCGNGNIAIGFQAGLCNCLGFNNIALGYLTLGTSAIANRDNVAIGYRTAQGMAGCGNIAIGGYGQFFGCGCNNISLGCSSLRSIQCACNNVAIGFQAGCTITTGCNNVILGCYPGTTTLSDTFVVQTGATERIKVDGTGLYINGTVFTGGGAGGGSGQFNTSISNQVGYSLTDKLFDLTGVAGTYTNLTTIVVGTTATNGVAAVMPSTTGTRYVIHSIHITNTAASDAEVTGRFDHTQGFGGTATIQGSLIDHTSLFASRLPVPSGSAVELIKKPQVLNPNDWIRLQSTTAAGGSGINGALTAFIVYDSSTDWNYTGVGINLASTSPTNVYTSALNTTTNTVTATNYPSVIESVRVTNYSNAADYRVTVPWTNSVGTVQSYLAYNMLIPAFATVELLEKPKRITSGDIIKAIPEAPNVLSIQVSGKLITTTFV
jgi:hypothetical protein